MKFTLTCTECGGTDIQPFYQTIGNINLHDSGLNCRHCGNIATMEELEAEWLVMIRAKQAADKS